MGSREALFALWKPSRAQKGSLQGMAALETKT